MDRFTGGTTSEKVINVDRIALDCHVYNLSTTTGWYVANGVVVHNCRCYAAPIFATPEPDDDGIVARRLREAQKSERGQLAAQVAAEDTTAGRIGTSLQNEVEVRDRITAGVERLRQHYIADQGN